MKAHTGGPRADMLIALPNIKIDLFYEGNSKISPILTYGLLSIGFATRTNSLLDLHRHPEATEHNVRLEDLILKRRAASAGLPAPDGLL